MNKKLMIGNEAVARGLWEAGCTFVSSYPGTPSTEITEFAAKYEEIYAEWATNEKVAVEAAIGASFAGTRSFSAMKHVGLNVAADPVFTVSYTGVNGGLVIAVADDMGMHSSQNEQDSRHYALAAKLPMLEPADSDECKRMTVYAFELSEQFDTPVLLRLSTRISHSQSAVFCEERTEHELVPYKKNPSKFVMMPAAARARHVFVEEREQRLVEQSEKMVSVEMGKSRRIGVIAAGIAYQTAKEALGDSVSYLKLNMVCPLPAAAIVDFAGKVEELWVIEELDEFIETFVLRLGIKVKGKSYFSKLGEYTANQIRKVVCTSNFETATLVSAPVRPPVLCPGCPHRGTFHVVNNMKLTVMGDIGCYTLGALPPLGAIDYCVCMGASISSLHGFLKARPEKATSTIAVIGDSTFMHTGMNGLVNIVYNQTPSTVLILDNSITGMTGHQQNPATGFTLKNQPAPVLDLEKLCIEIGVKRVRVVDPFELVALDNALKEELNADEPSVIIVRRPCVLLKSVKKEKALVVENCKNCKACMKIGCPAISHTGNAVSVDPSLCVGCKLCVNLCKFNALKCCE